MVTQIEIGTECGGGRRRKLFKERDLDVSGAEVFREAPMLNVWLLVSNVTAKNHLLSENVGPNPRFVPNLVRSGNEDVKPKLESHGLSWRAIRCLVTAGVAVEKAAVLRALNEGALYPFVRPTLYGKKTHQEVCRWAGVDESYRPSRIPEDTRHPVILNGLSARANHCLFRAGIPAEKPDVRQAIKTGALQPGKRPVNYGKQTHAEICRWAKD